MINSSELRIGNWIDLFDSETGHNFVQVTYSLLNADNFIDPVPLTPEILEKCGFKYKSEFYTIGKDLISFIFNEGKLQKTFVFIDTEFRQIRYLHELQNLYFALTGQELEIKL